MTTNNTEALRRIAVARALTSKDIVYWAKYSQGLRPVAKPGLGTFAVTRELVLLFDPDVAATQWTPEQVRFAFEHEVYHVALRHAERADKLREAEGATFDAHLWNICADFECNRLAWARGREVIPGICFAKDYGLPANVVAEVAYRTLREQEQGEQPDEPDEPGKQGEQGDDGDGGEGGDQPGDKPGDGDGEGEGKGKGKADKGKLGHGRCGSCAGGERVEGEDEVPEDAKASAIERDQLEREVAQAIVEQEAKHPGSVPGEVLRDAQAKLAPTPTPWQKILARHLRRAVDRRRGFRDYTFSRPARRQTAMGAGPGKPVFAAPFEPVVEVAVVVDTSGSMGGAELQAALAEIDGLLRASRNEVRVMSCDSKVHRQGKVSRVADAAKLMAGGGGTDFRPAFRALEQYRPGVTVVVTDGYGPAPESAPQWTDTVWVLVGQYTTRPCEWGEFVEVK